MPSMDLHEIRSKLKLVRDDGTSSLYENRGGAACPVCGHAFDEVLDTTERTRQVDPPERIAFCLVNEGDRVLLFTHA